MSFFGDVFVAVNFGYKCNLKLNNLICTVAVRLTKLNELFVDWKYYLRKSTSSFVNSQQADLVVVLTMK